MNKAFHPLTALCAAITLWALALFVLALLGLGAGFRPHPANPALMPAMPELSIASSSALGPVTDYLEVGQRPLLNPDRRPAPVLAGDTEASSAPLDASLTSVLISGDVRLAIVQVSGSGESQRVRLGELLPGTTWRLQVLEPRRAIFAGPSGEKSLDLRVFDGKGAAAPTASTVAGTRKPEPVQGTAKPDDARPQVVAETPQATADQQQAQVEAIRRRIEARRAQMRAEAAGNAAQKVD